MKIFSILGLLALAAIAGCSEAETTQTELSADNPYQITAEQQAQRDATSMDKTEFAETVK